ncbi:MAG: hypothetical protein EAZ60_03490 [Oscillatoriales cyanobacterium]|uniref:hypothetical protein n=1 Tax=unclassified Microcoleus TaxID=2642155 RepID=UPI001D484760|nr:MULTISPECIES: hypothetical protein [unclassified Microcoleus]TAE80696.1 MAG: hypothetical protein EAZ83_17615 [Oscillatoriales cyanobacterium]TAE95045.1 MAG: hypothetical protein EAZ79_20350 [Oscillatoriales cyanobacterium]TAF18203.1 MAG: hypothetical protein EAZ73_18910 [Oscillatoriales cyanobacterium]TAF37474.1 MAG: hypothetical protein EAZ69_07370 [Oscillatoriales cyanobacterium]TAF58404.1 MAG: hypothetical protein EAZ60_03490 [Oscillatoriales cyanobacterium]
MTGKKTRRNFILSSIAVAGGIAAANAIDQHDREIAAAPNNQAATTVKMPERLLGKTGIKVPIFGLGGAGQTPLSQQGREAEAAAQIERAIEPTFRRCGSDFFISCENLEAKRFWAEIMQC